MKKNVLLLCLLLIMGVSVFAKDDAPKTITPPEGKAVIYIVRYDPPLANSIGPSMGVGASIAKLSLRIVNKIDSIELKTTGRNEFVYMIVDPGKHKVACKGSTEETVLEVDTEAGKTYYVHQKYKCVVVGVFWCDLELLTDAKKIEKYMKNCELSD